ncbi:MAG: sulfite exporter TauE/SafE family protein [Bacteroidales bacterium]|nr:sulfite exporter TauE/SafE family protein [Bacteroidales bacterium]
MEFNNIILLIVTGLIAGVISGGFGVGGGIILIPALVFLFGMSQHEAQGTSLAVFSVPIGFIIAATNYHKKGFINYKFAAILILSFVVGTYFGSLLSVNLPANTIKRAFGALIVVVGLKMVFGK